MGLPHQGEKRNSMVLLVMEWAGTWGWGGALVTRLEVELVEGGAKGVDVTHLACQDAFETLDT